MRFLLTLNQKIATEWGLNLNEAIIFSILYESPNWAEEILINGRAFYFVSRNKICNELPLIDFKPDTVYRYIKKLESKKLIEWEKHFNKDCVRLTKKGKKWNYVKTLGYSSDHSDVHPNNSDGHPNLLGQTSESTSDGHPTYKDTNIYTDTNYKDTKYTEERQAKICPTPSDEQKSSLSSKKEKKESFTGRETRSNKYENEIKEVIEYLNHKTGRSFDSNAKTSIKEIKSRLKDGATVKEMKLVIDEKCNEWLHKKEMFKHLNPITLFRPSNFPRYLEDAKYDLEKSQAVKQLKVVVDEFVKEKKLIFIWDKSEFEAIQEIARKLKSKMIEEGDMTTMDNLELAFKQLLEKMDDFDLSKFSMKYINRNLNKILNGSKGNKQHDEWEQLGKRFAEFEAAKSGF